MLERLLKPEYRAHVVPMKKFKGDEVAPVLKRRGAFVLELKGNDVELEVESFLAGTWGRYTYVLKLSDGRMLARADRPVLKEVKGTKRYLARDEKGLERLILSELSTRAKLRILAPRWILWTAVGLSAFQWLRENFLVSFLLTAFGFVLDDVLKFLDCILLSYCRA